jgi:manganese/zinc/iron transport system permease protein
MLTSHDVWVMVIGAIVSVSCALLGCYLVLRRLSLLGDAISHAVLPGLAVAFFITGTRDLAPMFIGAMAVGMLTAFLSELIHRIGKVKHDASMGVVFTSLFALGVILISSVARQVDLDPACVLYGSIETLPLDRVDRLGFEAPARFLPLLMVLLLVVGFVVVLWKELKIVSFDPPLAVTMGISAGLIHYLLMGMVAGTTVAAFEAVGSILVVAMLIAPAATAHLLTDRLWLMMVLAGLHGVVSAVSGTVLAVWLDTSVAGMRAVAAGGLFAMAVIAAPHYGLVGRWSRRAMLSLRIVTEDALAMLYRWSEMSTRRSLSAREVAQALGGGMMPKIALWLLHRKREIQPVGLGVALTDTGSNRARSLVRSHRLWESYLSKHFALPADHLHEPAERMEHYISPPLGDAIARDVYPAQRDPHGQPIPGGGEDA